MSEPEKNMRMRMKCVAVLKGSGEQITWLSTRVTQAQIDADAENMQEMRDLVVRGMKDEMSGTVTIGHWVVAMSEIAAYQLVAIEDQPLVAQRVI